MEFAALSPGERATLPGAFFFDGRYVVTGSFNWTENAERRNRENLVILDCPEMAQVFGAEWESIRRDVP